MNILGGPALDRGARMVNFGRPEEYLYGTDAFDGWCQQGGAYNRDIVGVRIERAPVGVADALHAYFQARARARAAAAAAAARPTTLPQPPPPATVGAAPLIPARVRRR